MLSLSQSFCMSGSGASLEHNLRIVKTGGIRQIGVPERRCFNEHLLVDESLPKKDYAQHLLEKKVQEVIGDKLAVYNEKCIRNRHYNLVRDLQGFIDSQQKDYKGKKRSCITEIVLQVGDKFSGCSYNVATDSKGRMLDKGGRVIPEWDTRRIPAYRNGKVTESERCKLLKKVYRKYFKEFCEKNSQFVPLSCDIHADERGGCHCHITGFFVANTKTGLGVSLSRTSAIAQMLGNNGQNTRTSNAQNQWRANMRKLLEDVCKEFNIERKDMHNKEKHRNQKEYCSFADARCEAIERKEKFLNVKRDWINTCEESLKDALNEQNHKMIQMEWYKLKTKYPELYSKIHEEYLKERQTKAMTDKEKSSPGNAKKLKNVLDR